MGAPHPAAPHCEHAGARDHPADLDDLVTTLGPRLSRRSIKHCLNLVRGMLKAAMRAGHTKHDPFAAGVPLPKEVRTTDPWTFATPAEQERILAACKGPVRHLVAFAIATGLRAGELVSLRLADTHDDRVVVRYGGPPDLPTKSGKARTVFLNGHAKEALTAWLAALPAYTANKRHPQGRKPTGLAFPGRRGGFRCEEHVIRWAEWKGILEQAGVTRRFRFHDLRHTCASALVSGWWGRRWNLEEVREVLGHSTIPVTQRYAHLASDALANAARETEQPRCSPPELAPRPPRLLARQLAKLRKAIADSLKKAARPVRLERTTGGLEGRCSIQLSYGRVPAVVACPG